MPLQGSGYILVVQDFYKNGPLLHLCQIRRLKECFGFWRTKYTLWTVVGPLEKLNSDQGLHTGATYRAYILLELSKATELLSLVTPLRGWSGGTNKQEPAGSPEYVHGSHREWEKHIQLLLFVYHMSNSTGHHHMRSFFPSKQCQNKWILPSIVLCKKFLELREIVKANIVDSAAHPQEIHCSGKHISWSEVADR